MKYSSSTWYPLTKYRYVSVDADKIISFTPWSSLKPRPIASTAVGLLLKIVGVAARAVFGYRIARTYKTKGYVGSSITELSILHCGRFLTKVNLICSENKNAYTLTWPNRLPCASTLLVFNSGQLSLPGIWTRAKERSNSFTRVINKTSVTWSVTKFCNIDTII